MYKITFDRKNQIATELLINGNINREKKIKYYIATDLLNHKILFRQAQTLWNNLVDEYILLNGDENGSIVSGAGISIRVLPKGCRTLKYYKIVYADGNSRTYPIEAIAPKVIEFLKNNGIECQYEYGWMS